MKSFFSVTKLIGVDLGSSHIRIFSSLDGLVVNEPAYIAISEGENNKVIAVGKDAKEMKDRVGETIKVFQPIVEGNIYDMAMAKAMLRIFIEKAIKGSLLFSPIIMATVPASSTKVARKGVVSLFHQLGASEVYLISQPLAAAIGAGLPIADASGCFIFQIGAGIAEAAVISLGNIIKSKSTFKAGNYVDKLLQMEISNKYNLATSLEKIEQIKCNLASLNTVSKKEMYISGRDIVRSSPKELIIEVKDLANSLIKVALIYEELLKDLLSRVPSALIVDIIDKGLLLSGGVAQIIGLDEFLTIRLGIPVSLLEQADLTAIKGVEQALEHLDLFKESLGYRI